MRSCWRTDTSVPKPRIETSTLNLMVSFVQWAVVDVDADAPENAAVNPELEEGEFIEVFLVPFLGLHKTLVVSVPSHTALQG